MRKIGLTGGIGSGKSTAAGILAAQGIPLIDADALSRSLTQTGGLGMPEIRASFGAGVVAADGSLDRDAMRQMMLKDQTVKAHLEAILHPLIGQKIDQAIKLVEQCGEPMVVLDIPLLVEGDGRWRRRLDAVWLIDCLPQTQIARVQARSGWPMAQIEAVMAAQARRAQRLAASDAVIFNDGVSLHEFERQVLKLLGRAKA